MPLKAIPSFAKTFALISLRCDALIGATKRIEQTLLLSKAGIICLSGEVIGPGLDPYLRLAFGNIKTIS